MEQNTTILQGSSDQEKAAYLSAIASIATADRQATEEELAYIEALCESAELPEQYTQTVVNAANDASGQDLTQHLEVLKNSPLKYSLVADMMAFAKSDQNYSEEEKQGVQKVAQYLQVDQQQFSLLKEYTEKATEASETPEQVGSPNFLANSGLQQKMQSAGINTSGLLKGLLGIAGPIILANLVRRGFGGRGGGGLFGGGGGLNPFGGGGGNRGFGGGFGSLINMINGGRGMGSTGGLLGRIFGKGF